MLILALLVVGMASAVLERDQGHDRPRRPARRVRRFFRWPFLMFVLTHPAVSHGHVSLSCGTVRTMETSGWIAVRCIFQATWEGTQMYEERVTLWHATDTALAIERAEREAAAYAKDVDAEYIGLAQAYVVVDEPGEGGEVFSLIRASTLEPDAYVDRFFDTGAERTSGGRNS